MGLRNTTERSFNTQAKAQAVCGRDACRLARRLAVGVGSNDALLRGRQHTRPASITKDVRSPADRVFVPFSEIRPSCRDRSYQIIESSVFALRRRVGIVHTVCKNRTVAFPAIARTTDSIDAFGQPPFFVGGSPASAVFFQSFLPELDGISVAR